MGGSAPPHTLGARKTNRGRKGVVRFWQLLNSKGADWCEDWRRFDVVSRPNVVAVSCTPRRMQLEGRHSDGILAPHRIIFLGHALWRAFFFRHQSLTHTQRPMMPRDGLGAVPCDEAADPCDDGGGLPVPRGRGETPGDGGGLTAAAAAPPRDAARHGPVADVARTAAAATGPGWANPHLREYLCSGLAMLP